MGYVEWGISGIFNQAYPCILYNTDGCVHLATIQIGVST